MYRWIIIVLFFALNGSAQIINEICPANDTSFLPIPNWSPDWLELYNDTDEMIDLTGYSLTDDKSNLTKWSFIIGWLPADSYYQVRAERHHPNPTVVTFEFDKEGETIYLVNPAGIIIDSVEYPALQRDHSYGRIGNQWYYFDQPTPGDANSLSAGYKGFVQTPDFNLFSGAYKNKTPLILTCADDNATIYYQLNGQQTAEPLIYAAPLSLLESTTIMAYAEKDSFIRSRPTYRTYFIDEPDYSLPIVCINVDSLTLFDETTGICMSGPDASDVFPYVGANYWGDQKVPASFQYFNSDFELLESKLVDLKIHGGAGSRTHPVKSFQIRSREDPFQASYFSVKPNNEYQRLLLRNSGNDFCKTCIKDGTIHDYLIKSGLNVDFQAFQPVIVYLNRNYLGIQNLREKVDRYYLEANYGVDPETVNLLEGRLLTQVEGLNTKFKAILDTVETHDLNDTTYYNWVKKQVDLESMVDYFIVELFVNNRDWPQNNIKVWNAPEQPLWRYFCYDLDWGLKYLDYVPEPEESLRYILENLSESNPHVKLFNGLLQNDTFRRYFINRYADLMNTTFLPANFYGAFQMEKEIIQQDILSHYDKWCDGIWNWHQRLDAVETFLETRNEVIQNELISVFDQEGKASVVVDTYPYQAGTIQLNSLSLEEFPFEGTYFDGNTIDLSVHPYPGKTFLYWQNDRTGERMSSPHLTVNPKDGDRFIAVFEDEGDIFHLKIAPNPVISTMNLSFSIPAESAVQLFIASITGEQLMASQLGAMSMGSHNFSSNMSHLASGVYYLTIITEYGRETIPFYKS